LPENSLLKAFILSEQSGDNMVRKMSKDKKIIFYYCTRKYSIRQTAKAINASSTYVRKILHTHNLIRDKKEALTLRSTDEYRKKISDTKRGEKQAKKLTEQKVLAIRSEYENLINDFTRTEVQYALAIDYEVSRSTILDVIHRRTWTHI